jgi:hypothetical protein
MGADITRNVSAANDSILSTSRCSLLLAALDFLATAVVLVFLAVVRLEV